MPLYEVPIVFRGQDNFLVKADTPEQAADLAWLRFKNGDAPDELGNEWQEPEYVGSVRVVDGDECRLDDDKLDHAITRQSLSAVDTDGLPNVDD